MYKAARPMLAQETGARIDMLHPLLAKLLEEQLAGEQIAELTAFYASPTGKKLVTQAILKTDGSQLYEAAVKGKVEISEDQLAGDKWVAAMKSIGEMSPVEFEQLTAFGASPVAAKLKEITPQVQKLTLRIMSTPDGAADKRMEDAMSAALEAHQSMSDAPADTR